MHVTESSPPGVQPILVVGMNRSGTTWLTNILCNHPQIAGVQSPDHYGIIETNMFGHFQEMFGDLRFEENYRGLIELWSRTDFFRTAGANRRQLHQWSPHPTSYMEILQSVLDDFARRQQCPYWVQKVSPLRLHYLEELPQRARLVVILRQPVPTIRSAAQLIKNGNRHIWTGKIAFGYALQRKLLKRLIRTTRPCVVHYEALLEDAGGTVGRICEHLQLPFDASLLEQRYERNTSFGSKQSTSKADHDGLAEHPNGALPGRPASHALTPAFKTQPGDQRQAAGLGITPTGDGTVRRRAGLRWRTVNSGQVLAHRGRWPGLTPATSGRP